MIDIKKTYKNYVGGKYVRSESGKTYTKELKNEFYELPLTSKKDIRPLHHLRMGIRNGLQQPLI